MLMVIFGAGASYDSSPDFPPSAGSEVIPSEPWRPPLTNELFLDRNGSFGDIVQKYPRLHGILDFLRRPQKGRSVEQQLELYMDEAWVDQERKRQLFSVRYYLHDLFRMVSTEWLKRTNGVTNFATLIDQIRNLNTTREPVCLVSFNYDLLLDKVIFPGVNPPPLEQHFDAQPIFKLFKPHGSVDWARVVAAPKGTIMTLEHIIDNTPNLSDEYVRANATDTGQIYKFNWPIVPAIAIPVQTKTDNTFEWPDGHRKYLEELLPQVTKILIIGWQGKEAHFLKLLQEKLPTDGITQITHLQVVGRDPAESQHIREQFTQEIRRNVKKPYNGPTAGFSHFVREELVDFFFED